MVKAKELVSQSTRAICGAAERELLVPKAKVSSAIRTLRGAGYRVIGKSVNGSATRTVWFIPRGSYL